MSTIYLHGSYYGYNFGDVLIVDVFAKAISELGFDVVLPFATSKYASKLSTDVKVGVVERDRAIAGLFCGGGYFGEPSTGKGLWSIRNTFRHLRPYCLYRKERLPYIVVGVGYGPITKQPFKSVAYSIFQNAERVAVRDIESLELARADDVSSRMDVLSDVIVSLTLDDIPRSSLAHADELLTTTCGVSDFVVGIHLTDKYRDPEAFDNICTALEILARQNLNWHFLLICDGASRSRRRLQQEIDANRILKNLPRNRATIISYSGHWNLVALISKLGMVITSKLHVGIVASALRRNVVSIPYHSKTKRFYCQIGEGDRCLMDELTTESVVSHISRFINSPGVVVPEGVVEASTENFQMVHSFLMRQRRLSQ